MLDINYRMLAENSLDAILQISLDGIVEYASPSSFDVLGWAPEELEGRSSQDFLLPEDWSIIATKMEGLVSGQRTRARTIVRGLDRDGSVRWIETTAKFMRDPETGQPIATLLVQRDVSKRKAMEVQLSALARTDGLTGLANRRAFDEVLEREWGYTICEGSDLSLLLLDVDHFKAFNDNYGHQVGDDCLRTLSTAVACAVRRPGDFVARYGGEELVIILPKTDTAGAIDVAEQVQEAISALHLPHLVNPEGGDQATASIGSAAALARSGGTMSMPAGLLSDANSALYKAKLAGRNRIISTVIFTPKDIAGALLPAR